MGSITPITTTNKSRRVLMMAGRAMFCARQSQRGKPQRARLRNTRAQSRGLANCCAVLRGKRKLLHLASGGRRLRLRSLPQQQPKQTTEL